MIRHSQRCVERASSSEWGVIKWRKSSPGLDSYRYRTQGSGYRTQVSHCLNSFLLSSAIKDCYFSQRQVSRCITNSRMGMCLFISVSYLCQSAVVREAFPVRWYKEIQFHSFHWYSLLARWGVPPSGTLAVIKQTRFFVFYHSSYRKIKWTVLISFLS